MQLVLDALLETATAETNLSDFGEENFREGFEVLVDAFNRENNFHEAGAKAIRGGLLNSLTNRLKITAANAAHNVSNIEVPKPVFIIGYFRVGSTLLHQLLDRHPDLHGPKLWELYFPVSYPPGETEDAKLADIAQGFADAYFERAPLMKSQHYLEKNHPDECHRFFTNIGLSRIHLLRHRLPTYAAWLKEQDHTNAYRYHKHQIQHMLHRNGAKRPVLKCPTHFWNLSQLLSVYPDAKIIMLHRHMPKVLASTSNLCRTLRESFSHDVEGTRIGAEWQEDYRLGMDRMLKWREGNEDKIFDLRYKDLIKDPKSTFFEICEFIEAERNERLGDTIDSWMADNRQHKFGKKPYSLNEFGLSSGEINEKFSDYHERFNVPAEEQA
tara:strand:+ start:110888 stop:112036 length:1149 start_codon:yes stop_codon:yes gene_type:complete